MNASQVKTSSLGSSKKSARFRLPTWPIDPEKSAVALVTARQIGVALTPSASTPASQSVTRVSRPRPVGRNRAGRKPSLSRTKPSSSPLIAIGATLLATAVEAGHLVADFPEHAQEEDDRA